jgi:phospholipase/carboxylesterase
MNELPNPHFNADDFVPEPAWWHRFSHPDELLPQTAVEADPFAGVADPESIASFPHAIAFPDEGYEARYRYPLIVWLHNSGQSEDQIHRVLPAISERNYLGVGLRGDRTAGAGYDWSLGSEAVWNVSQQIEELVTAVGATLRIHDHRIYLAGQGTGGSLALQAFLQRPGLFAGAISLGGDLRSEQPPLANFRQLRGRRVMLSATSGDGSSAAVDMVATGRLLYTAGLDVSTRCYALGQPRWQQQMLREVDHWIMADIRTAVRV